MTHLSRRGKPCKQALAVIRHSAESPLQPEHLKPCSCQCPACEPCKDSCQAGVLTLPDPGADGTNVSLDMSLASRRSHSLGDHLSTRGSEGAWDRGAANAVAAAAAVQRPPPSPPHRRVFICSRHLCKAAPLYEQMG